MKSLLLDSIESGTLALSVLIIQKKMGFVIYLLKYYYNNIIHKILWDQCTEYHNANYHNKKFNKWK